MQHSVILELQEKLQCIECVKKISTKFIKELMRLTAVWALPQIHCTVC